VSRVRIGCSGWSYEHWRGVLYPDNLPKARWRDAYTAEFDTVELNASFYRWPGTAQFERWRETLPTGFTMAVKASRWITHARRLRDPDGAWADRLEAAWRALGDRAGPVLLQLHPDHERDDHRLHEFLDRLHHDVPVAVEMRHPSWHTDEVLALLERHGAAYVVMHGAGLPCRPQVTARFAYVRLHGASADRLYEGAYDEDELQRWAARIHDWSAGGHDVWVYFNNDLAGHAVRDARLLRRLVGTPGRVPDDDGSTPRDRSQ
jgi:uncharacterized protein YecE (DUF72 family)